MRIFLILSALLLASCGGEPKAPLVATDVVVTHPMPGTKMSAAYMSLTNNTDQMISISRIASPQFDSVALHETTIEDGVARMRAMHELPIPGGGTVTLLRGGKHLMLMRPTDPADTVTLKFYSGDALILSVDATFDPKTN